MQVGVYLTFPKDKDDCTNYVLADILLRSIRQHMPGVKVSQFTDEKSPAVYGVDEVRRKPKAALPLLRSAHFADAEGEWLFLDTDIVIQKDVRAVFDEPFDVALCDRQGLTTPVEENFAKEMPFNAGVIFSRNPDFWKVVHARVARVKKLDPWFGDQKIIGELAQSGEFNVKVLPGQQFNCPPASATDTSIDQASIVHYKGNRKEWMLARL